MNPELSEHLILTTVQHIRTLYNQVLLNPPSATVEKSNNYNRRQMEKMAEYETKNNDKIKKGYKFYAWDLYFSGR